MHSLRRLSIPLWSDFIFSQFAHVVNPALIFQSHYGLILSLTPLRPFLSFLHTFNPTMVWFYPKRSNISFTSSSLFQSHYGLILSENCTIKKDRMILTFNPTMVWFYLVELSDVKLCATCFAFNPTMVWFYHKPIHDVPACRKELSIPLWSDFIFFLSCI